MDGGVRRSVGPAGRGRMPRSSADPAPPSASWGGHRPSSRSGGVPRDAQTGCLVHGVLPLNVVEVLRLSGTADRGIGTSSPRIRSRRSGGPPSQGCTLDHRRSPGRCLPLRGVWMAKFKAPVQGPVTDAEWPADPQGWLDSARPRVGLQLSRAAFHRRGDAGGRRPRRRRLACPSRLHTSGTNILGPLAAPETSGRGRPCPVRRPRRCPHPTDLSYRIRHRRTVAGRRR